MSPTPEQHLEPGDHLADRVQGAREQLTELAADTEPCEDIASGVSIGLGGLNLDISDRTLKRDIAPVGWSR